MYLKQCVDAYAAVAAMMEKEWDYETAHALVMLKRKLQPQVDFFAKEEMKLAKEYAKLDKKGNIIFTERGTFPFREQDKAQEYAERRTRLGMVEAQEDFKPLRVPMPERITPAQLEALEGFLEFEELEGGSGA